MSRRTYGQYCALARTLDIVGERWTLLIGRELARGPKRYSDILDGLPGINTTLLAQRLRDLEGHGIVGRRKLPPPAASVVYELTEVGEELVGAMLPLVAWGVRHALGSPRSGEEFRVVWVLLAIRESMDPASVAGLTATYEFDVEGSTGHMRIVDGLVEIGEGVLDDEAPDVRLLADADAFVGVGTGRLDAGEMMAAGRMTVEGEPSSVATFARVMGVTEGAGPWEAGPSRRRREDTPSDASPSGSRARR